MDAPHKEQLLHTTKEHIADTTLAISEALVETEKKLNTGSHEMWKLSYADQMVQQTLTLYNQKRLEELASLLPSPYFVRCEVELEGKGKDVMYFAKFPFTEKSVYWWVAPAAAIRFENPGRFSFTKHDGTVQRGTLIRKDNYLIVDGNLVFFGTEGLDAPRELIFQEHFTTRKQGFVLPEIVAQMEKVQDQIVRVHYKGPFVIAGPAGSGKTTLALHRVAFLVQSPETAEKFQGNSTVVFVQDGGTKQYFSHLLPELGIHDVVITTFSEWAQEILPLTGVTVVTQISDDRVPDAYEWKKIEILKEKPLPTYANAIFSILDNHYKEHLPAELYAYWKKQHNNKVLDRIDITLLLMAYQQLKGKLEREQTYIVPKKNGSLERKTKKFPITYSLMLVDEFQNYLPEQLRLMRECVQKENQSLIYVGDMAQQIYPGTLRNWEEIEENISPERQVMLHKVYRNTKEILEYLQKLGYAITIPTEIRTGQPVKEIVVDPVDEEGAVAEVISTHTTERIGIIGYTNESIARYKEMYRTDDRVHVLTMIASQGVEFDVVMVVGVSASLFELGATVNSKQELEKKKIIKDVWYVALTRASQALYVMGVEPLSQIQSFHKIIEAEHIP